MFKPLTELDYFRALIADPKRIPLFEAAAAIAHDEYPGLDLQQVLAKLDVLGKGLAERCKDASTELKRVSIATTYFYRELGFAGNVNDYYDPNNSYLHKVLETRRGIPITLAVIYLELVSTIGLDAQGISFPGHFLVRINLHEGPVVLDPFTGYSLSQEDLLERLRPLRDQLGLAADDNTPIRRFLAPSTPLEILSRMLRNLQSIYSQSAKSEQLARVLHRMQLLDASAASPRDRPHGR